MKILAYSDIHWNVYSSVIRQRGTDYSIRLEGLIKSMNWINELAKKHDCKLTVCCGDFLIKQH